MEVLYDIQKCALPSSVALGYFDGLHKGHLSVINQTKKSGLSSVVFTFDDNPQNFFHPHRIKQIYTIEKKISVIRSLNVDKLYLIPFSKIHFLDPLEFIETILINKLNTKHISCGFNFHFGCKAKATAFDLKKICSNKNIQVDIIEATSNDQGIISSTKIRNLISSGDIQSANKMLSIPFGYNLPISNNNSSELQIVKQIIPENIIQPKPGVYESQIQINNIMIPSYTNVYTLNERCILETKLSFNKKENLYQKYIEIQLKKLIK